jgi:hypothetical protein
MQMDSWCFRQRLRDNLLGPTQLRHEKYFEETPAVCRQQFVPDFHMYMPLIRLRHKFAQAAQPE